MEMVLIVFFVMVVYFIYALLKSARKSKDLKELSEILGRASAPSSLQSLLNTANTQEEAENRMTRFVMNNAGLRNIVDTHSADDHDLLKIYKALCSSGAGWEAGHFVPLSAIMFPATLDYALRKTENGRISDYNTWVECSAALSDYFRNRKVGKVD